MRDIDEAIDQPWGTFFRIERTAGTVRMGDPVSHFNGASDLGELTFDISNNKVLANVGPQGAIRTLTIYRDSYRAACDPAEWPGVWTAKDLSSYGPYSFGLDVDGDTYDLATVDWDFRTGLLDNIFPITELRDPAGRFVVRLLSFAPISADGSQRLRGLVYGLHLENFSGRPLAGVVRLPRLFASGRPRNEVPWAQFDPYDFEIGLADAPAFRAEVPFDLEEGETLWTAAILYAPGEPVVEEVNSHGAAAWLAETWRYYRGVLGRLETPGDSFLAEFYERELLQALQSVAISGRDKMAGSNWGSSPPTRQIWSKDCYYACLPFMAREPELAQKMILWFAEFGVRQKGVVFEGGVGHSIGLSVSSLLLAGLYYDATADRRFFRRHPELEKTWRDLADEVLKAREEKGVWLFPTRFISDGAVEGDYHTGSNVCVWRAFQGYARLLAEVYRDRRRARRFAEIAEKIHSAILRKNVVDGPRGPQFVEAAYRDGRAAPMISDGEESDTTLMPFYGFLPYDGATYLNSMRFAMSPDNPIYQPRTHAISWAGEPISPLENRVPSTAPCYNKGLCAGTDEETLFGEHGFYTELRRVADADGSIWWWPYGDDAKGQYGEVRRGGLGKSGWASGVHSAIFVSRFLGLSYDAPMRRLRVAPFPLAGGFSWTDFPMGIDRFNVTYNAEAGSAWATVRNLTNHAVRLEVTLPIDGAGEAFAVAIDGKRIRNVRMVSHFGRQAIHACMRVPAHGAADIRIAGAAAEGPG